MESRLILFDIDGTLMDLGGIGLRALRAAAAELHGEGCPELDLRGATDSGLVREVLGAYGVAVNDASVGQFFASYLVHLRRGLAGADPVAMLLPGVRELLDGLRAEGATLGLLTGNIAAGAWAKVGRFGLADYFSFGAFGDDHHDRNELGPIALKRAAEVHGREFEPEQAVVIGDTPKDVACGKALGAVTVCVATGQFDAQELRRCGADLVLESFAGGGRDLMGVLRVPADNRS